jgi:hypothetical protein
MPLDEVVATVVREAERQGDREMIRVWFSMLFWHLEGVPLAKLRENPLVRELRAAAKRTEAAWLQSKTIPMIGDGLISHARGLVRPRAWSVVVRS